MGFAPCGFCGLETADGSCTTKLILQDHNQEPEIISNCTYFHPTLVRKGKLKDSKSTNIPIHCDLCPPSETGKPATIWKYNAIYHGMIKHPKHVFDPDQNCYYRLPTFSNSMRKHIFISQEEERVMGIEHELTLKARKEYDLPHSDDIPATPSPQKKRERAPTKSVISPKSKKQKDGN